MLAEQNKVLMMQDMYGKDPRKTSHTMELTDHKGRTPLYRAAELNHFLCVRTLVQYGADYRRRVNDKIPSQVVNSKYCPCSFRETANILKNAENNKSAIDPRAADYLGREEYFRRINAGWCVEQLPKLRLQNPKS